MRIDEAKEVLKYSGFTAKEIGQFTKRQIHGKASGLMKGQTVDRHTYTPPKTYSFAERICFWIIIVLVGLFVLSLLGISLTDMYNFGRSLLWGVGFMILFALFGKGIDGEI